MKDFIGSYSQYHDYLKDYEKEKAAREKAARTPETTPRPAEAPERKRKLSWKESRELEELEKALPELESEKASIEEKLSGGLLDPDEVRKLSGRYSEVQALLDEKETRWLELQL